jgi:hypothetical protein
MNILESLMVTILLKVQALSVMIKCFASKL